MTVLQLLSDPTPDLAAALTRFESEFSYPLGNDARFHVHHDGDCWRFFHALGDATCAIDVHNGDVLGVLGAAQRDAVMPDNSTLPMLYIGDLKITARARGGLTLLRLARVIQQRYQDTVSAAYAVVMDGTDVIPTTYTGRMGIPPFVAVDHIAVLWIRTTTTTSQHDGWGLVPTDLGSDCFHTLTREHIRLSVRDHKLRSLMTPRWLMADNGGACGLLEDTLRSKRLRSTTGEDMRSAHVSCFAYRDVRDGMHLLDSALNLASAAGYPMLFTAMNATDATFFCEHLGNRVRSHATATVYATGISPGPHWAISTADI